MGAAASRRILGMSRRDEVTEHDSIDPDRSSDLWVTVRAKTTDKVTRNSTSQQWVFRASTSGVTLGHPGNNVEGAARPGCAISDPSMLPSHARIALRMPEGLGQGQGQDTQPYVELTTMGRTYFLVGRKGNSGVPHPLTVGNTLKLGACSLQVADAVFSRDKKEDKDKEHGNSTGEGRSSESGDEAPEAPRPCDDDVCYICFEGPGDALGANEDEEDAEDRTPGRTIGPLIPSPCQCGKLVHRCCLLKWVASKGARQCSICKSKLPIEATVDPPYLVLQVVRHMRNLRWDGEREFILSFAHPKQGASSAPGGPVMVNVGTGSTCDLVLPDPSLSRMHARITYNPRAPGAVQGSNGLFTVEDLGSQAGTYLRVQAGHPFRLPMEGEAATVDGAVAGADTASNASSVSTGRLSPAQSSVVGVARFKMGRTVLTIRVKKRRPLRISDMLASMPGIIRRTASGTIRKLSAGSALEATGAPSPVRSPVLGFTTGASAASPVPPAALPPIAATPEQTGSAGEGIRTARLASKSVGTASSPATPATGPVGGAGSPGTSRPPTMPNPMPNPSPGPSAGPSTGAAGGPAPTDGPSSARSSGKLPGLDESGLDALSSGRRVDPEEARLEAAFTAAMEAAAAEGRVVDPDAPLAVELVDSSNPATVLEDDDVGFGGGLRFGDTAEAEEEDRAAAALAAAK